MLLCWNNISTPFFLFFIIVVFILQILSWDIEVGNTACKFFRAQLSKVRPGRAHRHDYGPCWVRPATGYKFLFFTQFVFPWLPYITAKKYIAIRNQNFLVVYILSCLLCLRCKYNLKIQGLFKKNKTQKQWKGFKLCWAPPGNSHWSCRTVARAWLLRPVMGPLVMG